MGDQQDTNPQETPAESQETPTQDSGLQTPQPDQPVPTEAERSAQDAQPTESAPARDQVAEQAQRESDLEAQRREHNERTGGGDVNENELQAQRDEHNERTGDPSQSQD